MLVERIDEDEIWAALRENEYSSLEEVSAVVWETNGSLTVINQIKDTNARSIKKLFD